MGSSTAEYDRLLQEARLRLARGDFLEAVARASEAVRLDGKEPAAYLVRAEAQRRLKRPDQAVADLAVAIRLDPNQPAPYLIRAKILKRRCLFDQAIADATNAVILDPRNAAAYSLRAECRIAIGDREGAAEDVQEVLRIDPTRPVPDLRDTRSSREAPGADGRFWKQPGDEGPDDERTMFADGRPVDRSLKSRKPVRRDPSEVLADVSDYRPEVLPTPLPRVRPGRGRGGNSWLAAGLALLCAGLIGFVVAGRGGSPPERPSSVPATVAQSPATQPAIAPAPFAQNHPSTPSRLGHDPLATNQPSLSPASAMPDPSPPFPSAPAASTTSQPAGLGGDVRPAAAVSLLRNDTLDGWQTTEYLQTPNWTVRDGILTYATGGPSLMTTERFKDFELHLEYLLPPRCNSGLFLRGRYEVQLVDPALVLPSGRRLAPSQNNGAIYDQIPPQRIVFSGVNRWNSLDVRLVDRNVSVSMNGVLIIDDKRVDRVTQFALDDREGEPGPIVLQGHAVTGSRFRNIRITPLTEGQRTSRFTSPGQDAGAATGATATASQPGPLGRWVELRPGTPAGDRVRTFQPDGTLIFGTVKDGQTTVGTWRREGERVYFKQSARDADEKWFTISAQDARTMTVLMMGARQYVWYRSS
jgi:hypothetical protein